MLLEDGECAMWSDAGRGFGIVNDNEAGRTFAIFRSRNRYSLTNFLDKEPLNVKPPVVPTAETDAVCLVTRTPPRQPCWEILLKQMVTKPRFVKEHFYALFSSGSYCSDRVHAARRA